MTHRLRLLRPGGPAFAAVGVALLAIALVFLADSGNLVLIIFTLIVTLGIFAVALLGADQAGFGLICVGFAVAAWSKGHLATPIGPSLTVSDLALAGGLGLLLPRLVANRSRVSASYGVGLILIIITGSVASALIDPSPLSSFKTLVGMIWCMLLLPLGIAAARPDDRRVRILAWSFIAGHMISVLYAFTTTPIGGRQEGLTAHPNEYAESGLIVIALGAYLLGRTTKRIPIYAVMTLAGLSIYLSGSRGALVSLAALLLVVPFIERTTLGMTFFVGVVALGAAIVPFVTSSAGSDSAIGRLLGSASASGSDQQRNAGLHYGLHEFAQRPITGSGLSDPNLVSIHINLLEIVVSMGIFGLTGFLLVLFSLARPMFGNSPYRRLAYVAVAFVAFGVTAPSLTDRSMWLAMSLGFVYFRGFANEASGTPEEHELVVNADHLPQLV